MKRYSNIDYMMSMNADDGLELIITAITENKRDESYKMYLAQVPVMLMSGSDFVSFDDYYKGTFTSHKTNPKIDKEKVYDNVENILNNYEI